MELQLQQHGPKKRKFESVISEEEEELEMREMKMTDMIIEAFKNAPGVEHVQLLLSSKKQQTNWYEFARMVRSIMSNYQDDGQCLQVLAAICNRIQEEQQKTEAPNDGVWRELFCYQVAVEENRSHEVVKALCPRFPGKYDWSTHALTHEIIRSAFAYRNETAILLLYRNNWKFFLEKRNEHFKQALIAGLSDVTHYFMERSVLDPRMFLMALDYSHIYIRVGRVACIKSKALRGVVKRFHLSSELLGLICAFGFCGMDGDLIMCSYKADPPMTVSDIDLCYGNVGKDMRYENWTKSIAS